ncbi:MAG: uncharacterized protein KVP18_002872 [Porospora cf. gigantea A]|uniref:uncharacterized protein n=2 Tax=Porospora cf. gigantea A TaxID=2853593 RepID=UPI00355A9715|nr:MAG: hypothetical protein KVP18_002872 [Porospora cf. gigantea A]
MRSMPSTFAKEAGCDDSDFQENASAFSPTYMIELVPDPHMNVGGSEVCILSNPGRGVQGMRNYLYIRVAFACVHHMRALSHSDRRELLDLDIGRLPTSVAKLKGWSAENLLVRYGLEVCDLLPFRKATGDEKRIEEAERFLKTLQEAFGTLMNIHRGIELSDSVDLGLCGIQELEETISIEERDVQAKEKWLKENQETAAYALKLANDQVAVHTYREVAQEAERKTGRLIQLRKRLSAARAVHDVRSQEVARSKSQITGAAVHAMQSLGSVLAVQRDVREMMQGLDAAVNTLKRRRILLHRYQRKCQRQQRGASREIDRISHLMELVSLLLRLHNEGALGAGALGEVYQQYALKAHRRDKCFEAQARLTARRRRRWRHLIRRRRRLRKKRYLAQGDVRQLRSEMEAFFAQHQNFYLSGFFATLKPPHKLFRRRRRQQEAYSYWAANDMCSLRSDYTATCATLEWHTCKLIQARAEREMAEASRLEAKMLLLNWSLPA